MAAHQPSQGKLFVVATPIGNLGDLTPRAQQTLREVDLVLAEDTRSFGILKKKFDINTAVRSYHDHSERKVAPEAVKKILNGENIALVSEAGTPCISDPGYHLVKACRRAGIVSIVVPGPSAVISALSISGFEINRFTFGGFLPQKGGKRKTALEQAVASDTTTVFYESPFRLLKTLTTLAEVAPNLDVMVARELTKIHEECVSGSATEVLKEFSDRPSIKGEIVIVLRSAEHSARDYQTSER